jgi:hypothetical protein
MKGRGGQLKFAFTAAFAGRRIQGVTSRYPHTACRPRFRDHLRKGHRARRW